MEPMDMLLRSRSRQPAPRSVTQASLQRHTRVTPASQPGGSVTRASFERHMGRHMRQLLGLLLLGSFACAPAATPSPTSPTSPTSPAATANAPAATANATAAAQPTA